MAARMWISEDDALRDMTEPLGVAEFTHLEKQPEVFKGPLPPVVEIEDSELSTWHGSPLLQKHSIRVVRRQSPPLPWLPGCGFRTARRSACRRRRMEPRFPSARK